MKYPSESFVRKSIGAAVKRKRIQMGISQAKLCYEIDIDISTLSRLERGLLNVTLQTLYKIGKSLNTPIEKFFDEV